MGPFMDYELLSRFQFGLTVAFHYIFPPEHRPGLRYRDGLAGCGRRTPVSPDGLDVDFRADIRARRATGIVMEFQPGRTGPPMVCGDVFGSAAAEDFCVFMESGFLAIAGWDRARPAGISSPR